MASDVLREKVVYSKSLLVSAMLFITIVMAANFVGQKPLLIFGLIVSSGSAIFPLTYLISVIVTEIYGRECAKNIIATGFICNILVAIFILLSLQFPHPEFWTKKLQYEAVMQQTWKILVLSSFAYIVSEYTNLNVFTYVTKRFKQRYFQLRVFCSTLCAVIIDTLFLIPIMVTTSPTYMIIVHKIISLIIFKSCFVFSGILFISFIRDYIIKSENKRRQLSGFSHKDEGLEVDSISNVYWYQHDKRSR